MREREKEREKYELTHGCDIDIEPLLRENCKRVFSWSLSDRLKRFCFETAIL